MRKLHYSVSKYSEPFSIVKYITEYIDGVKVETKHIIYKNVYGSMMRTDKLETGNTKRSINCDISLLTPKPPFNFDDSYRIIIGDAQYVINSVNYNQITRGEIQLLLNFEKHFFNEEVEKPPVVEEEKPADD